MTDTSKSHHSSQESFYSLDNSRTSFSVLEEPPAPTARQTSSKLVSRYGLKPSSVIMDQSDSNDGMQTIYMGHDNEFQGLTMHDISHIGNTERQEL
jgi:hypothetical protein